MPAMFKAIVCSRTISCGGRPSQSSSQVPWSSWGIEPSLLAVSQALWICLWVFQEILHHPAETSSTMNMNAVTLAFILMLPCNYVCDGRLSLQITHEEASDEVQI